MTQGRPQPSLNSLIFEVCHGPTWKKGKAIVFGILNHVEAIRVIASIGRPVLCYDTSESRTQSKLKGNLSAFSLPKKPPNAEYFIDEKGSLDLVGTLFLFEDSLIPCNSFLPGATIVGNETRLREALKGYKFFPCAYWRDLAAMEITHDP